MHYLLGLFSVHGHMKTQATIKKIAQQHSILVAPGYPEHM